jgi:hypothetical protein
MATALNRYMKFQRALVLATRAANPFEAAAAERAARRMVTTGSIDPTRCPDMSFDDDTNFADNVLLRKLREEWRTQHPPRKRRPAKPKPPESTYDFGFLDQEPVNTTKVKARPKAEPAKVATKPKKPRSADRHLQPNRDRHSPGYMREYMRRWRAAHGRP